MATLVGAYHLRVHEKRQRKFENLDSIGGAADFLDFAQECLQTCKTDHHNDIDSQRIALIERVEVDGRVIEGRIEVGDYGNSSNVRNVEDAKTVFKKKKLHADALPIFFRLEIPTGRDEGLLLIEKSRKTSPKTAFSRMLSFHFKEKFEGYQLAINPVLPEQVFSEYLSKGSVQKIRFIQMGIPSDITDLLDGGHKQIVGGKTEVVVTAPRYTPLPIKKSILRAKDPFKAVQDLYELTDVDYTNVQIEVMLGRNRRKIDLGRRYTSPLHDITADVRLGPDGNPEYESMSEAFEKLAADIQEGAYAGA